MERLCCEEDEKLWRVLGAWVCGSMLEYLQQVTGPIFQTELPAKILHSTFKTIHFIFLIFRSTFKTIYFISLIYKRL